MSAVRLLDEVAHVLRAARLDIPPVTFEAHDTASGHPAVTRGRKARPGAGLVFMAGWVLPGVRRDARKAAKLHEMPFSLWLENAVACAARESIRGLDPKLASRRCALHGAVDCGRCA